MKWWMGGMKMGNENWQSVFWEAMSDFLREPFANICSLSSMLLTRSWQKKMSF